jgi:hypothetical protein
MYILYTLFGNKKLPNCNGDMLEEGRGGCFYNWYWKFTKIMKSVKFGENDRLWDGVKITVQFAIFLVYPKIRTHT